MTSASTWAKVLACLLGVLVATATASAGKKGGEEEDEAADEEPSEDDAKPKKKDPDDKDTEKEPKEFKKQDLNGHDGATEKKSNLFEKDRFFVDKSDTDKTEGKTLTQGSLTSTSFLYRESGDTIAPMGANVPSASQFTRLFTDLRLQTDFRHLGGGKWDARVDVRGRFTSDPGSNTPNYTPVTNSASQSGFLGQNELEVRELWLIRNGKRSDVTLGRQFVADLAGVKIDGLRIDYAASSKFTYLGFGGLYPIRGSRSVTTDYQPLLGNPDPATGVRAPAGRFTAAGGFGAAYRTQNSYGAFGGVALAPLSSEGPRIFGTSTGYWRAGPKLDFYHFVVLDAVGANAVNAGLTNLSAGLNFKPDQRLRGTFSFNRVDTETLNVQAQAFLSNPEKNINIIQNEAFLFRVAQNEARGSLSAGLGSLQRFEVTAALAFRYRNELTLTSPATTTPLSVILPAGKSVEVYGSITDRRSFANTRIGIDGSRIFKVGDATYQHTASTTLRGSVGRELENGHGEWEAEIAYSTTQDDSAGAMTTCADFLTCFGASTSNILSVGGSLFYRFNRDWFGMGGLFVNRQNLTSFIGTTANPADSVTGISGFVRAAYRF